MTPLKQQISLIPFSIEHWYTPYKRRRSENQSRSGWLLVVIRICATARAFRFFIFFTTVHWGIDDFPTFVSISRFSQFSYNQQPISTKPLRNEWRRRMYPQFWNKYSTDIRIQINPKIRIHILIAFVSNFGVSGGLHSVLQTEHL